MNGCDMNSHLESCEMFPVECTNGCTMSRPAKSGPPLMKEMCLYIYLLSNKVIAGEWKDGSNLDPLNEKRILIELYTAVLNVRHLLMATFSGLVCGVVKCVLIEFVFPLMT